MQELKGKRMLLMSGSTAAREIVNEAHRMGIAVYATDYYTTSPVKEISDKSFMVSTADVDAIAALCRDEKIDGIFSGYTDSVLPYMQQVAEKLSIPFWGTAENIRMSINKELFKSACEQSNVPVVPWKKVTLADYKTTLANIHLPIVFKPVDNSGSRGVFKCFQKEDILPLCEKSFEFSQSKELLVERLMNAHNEFSVYYIMNHGNIYLTGMGDRYVYEISPDVAPVGQGMRFPSIRLDQWISEMDPVMKQFFRANDMNNGFVFVQGFHEDGRFYIHEIGYRLNGGFSFKLVEHFCGYNQMQQLIRFSMTGSMEDTEIQKSNPYFHGGVGMILTATLRKGKVSAIEGLDAIRNLSNVIECYQLIEMGTEIISQGTTAEVFAYFILAASTKKTLIMTIHQIKSMLEVRDEHGQSMLHPMLNSQN